MELAFKRITIPESIWSKVEDCKLFSILMPKGSIVLQVSRGNGCYMYIQYPKDMADTQEEIFFFTVPADCFGELGEMTVNIPENTESYRIDGNFSGMNPGMLFGLKNK